ncbi:hypothetical protein BKP37_08380 [Anaerobacillus alkalilacustris]|uniref:DUF5671 domain-containing protein n=1 Tax=Anaerobacillus alkalilacustris TaxID=393763 RepID=A0A1S2LPT0_9BACI|nr:hypothetical protein [Anaerobacillus alkalilacustris]OIJ14354.1 hypothetical protein BKP37_08380 [Anaerobacillus alkalilacustris]
MVSLLFPIVFLCVVLFIIFVIFAGKHGESDQERVNELIKNLYVYLVCFATLMMSIGGGVGLFMAASDIIVPNDYYMSYEEYKMNQNYKFTPDNERVVEEYNEEEMRAMYNNYREAEIERSKNRAKNSLIKSFGWIIIPLPIFILFSRRLRKQQA